MRQFICCPQSCPHAIAPAYSFCFRCALRCHFTHYSFGDLLNVGSLAAFRPNNISNHLTLSRARYLTVTTECREYLFVSEILAPSFEFVGRLAPDSPNWTIVFHHESLFVFTQCLGGSPPRLPFVHMDSRRIDPRHYAPIRLSRPNPTRCSRRFITACRLCSAIATRLTGLRVTRSSTLLPCSNHFQPT